MFDLNVLAVLLASKAAVAHFDAAGGSIINISSIASSLTPAKSAVYSASKAAVDAVTRVLAKELGPRNIRVNAINPGTVETEGCTPPASTRATSSNRSRPRRRWAASARRGTSRRPPSSWPPARLAGSPVRRW
jgi:3-oxoacyl-[acyl-carrier protein] reductase